MTHGYYRFAKGCLSGGPVPTGYDICDHPEDMDPFFETAVEIPNIPETDGGYISKRHPRRAYGLPIGEYRTVVKVKQTEQMSADFIRFKLEAFFTANNITVNDNNYSFPIGPRPEWDHYRRAITPNSWYCWNATLLYKNEEPVILHIRLYVSHIHTAYRPATLLLDCTNVSGRNSGYWPMMKTLSKWILGTTDAPEIEYPPVRTIEVDGEIFEVLSI